MPRGVAQQIPIVAEAAAGAVICDPGGRRLIDFAGGIGTVNVGHCHPRVVEAIRLQASRLVHTCFQVATYDAYVALAER